MSYQQNYLSVSLRACIFMKGGKIRGKNENGKGEMGVRILNSRKRSPKFFF